MPDTFNILMYSHDTYGLGHIRRTMAIAQHLVDTDVNILILTGSPIAGRFTFPMGVDFVRIPGMIKQSNTVYVPHSIKVEPQQALNIRQEIITATAKAFDPSMFIVDKVPVGLKGEVRPVLEWFKSSRPQTKVILGLRDILDDAESTRRDWQQKNYFNVLRKLYSEVWIYGEKSFYNPITEYAFPKEVADKCVFTGYISRAVPKTAFNYDSLGGHAKPDNAKLVVVTAGGGGDGYQMLDTYMRMIEEAGGVPYRTVMISGPFLSMEQQDELAARAKQCGVAFSTFQKRMEKILASADLVISMGGYNTVCEILSLKRVALIIPRETPRLEQLIRAQALKKAGLADYLKWDQLETTALREKVETLLHAPESYVSAMNAFSMTGLDVMRSRLSEFRKE